MPTKSKPLSRTAKLRLARQIDRYFQIPTVSTELTWDGVPDDLRVKAEAFVPKDIPPAVWEQIRFVTLVLTASFHRKVKSHISAITFIANFLAWFLHCPLRLNQDAPLAATDLLTAVNDPVEAYIATRKDLNLSSQRTYRWICRTAVENLTQNTKTLVLPRTQISNPPLSEQEIADLIRFTQIQPTNVRKRNANFIVWTGLGAGIDHFELGQLDAGCFEEYEGNVWITVPPGHRLARTIRVLDIAAPYLTDALDRHYGAGKTADDAIIGRKVGGKNNITSALKWLTTADGNPIDIDPARLRATWLLTMLAAPIPLHEFLYLAGIQNSSPVTKLLDYLPATTHEYFESAFATTNLVAAGGAK